MTDSRAAQRLRRAAATVLLAGAAAAALVFLLTRGEEGSNDFGAGSVAETRELQQLERLGGQYSVLMLKFQLWFESLWHGPRLAVTLLVLSVLVAGFCWHLATLAEEEGPDQ